MLSAGTSPALIPPDSNKMLFSLPLSKLWGCLTLTSSFPPPSLSLFRSLSRTHLFSCATPLSHAVLPLLPPFCKWSIPLSHVYDNVFRLFHFQNRSGDTLQCIMDLYVTCFYIIFAFDLSFMTSSRAVHYYCLKTNYLLLAFTSNFVINLKFILLLGLPTYFNICLPPPPFIS